MADQSRIVLPDLVAANCRRLTLCMEATVPESPARRLLKEAHLEVGDETPIVVCEYSRRRVVHRALGEFVLSGTKEEKRSHVIIRPESEDSQQRTLAETFGSELAGRAVRPITFARLVSQLSAGNRMDAMVSATFQHDLERQQSVLPLPLPVEGEEPWEIRGVRFARGGDDEGDSVIVDLGPRSAPYMVVSVSASARLSSGNQLIHEALNTVIQRAGMWIQPVSEVQ